MFNLHNDCVSQQDDHLLIKILNYHDDNRVYLNTSFTTVIYGRALNRFPNSLDKIVIQ